MAAKKKQPTFEEQLAKLEAIVGGLDAEDLPLEKAIEAYEEGVQLSYTLNKTLEEAQRKIEVLTQTAGGRLEPRPFEEPNEPGGS